MRVHALGEDLRHVERHRDHVACTHVVEILQDAGLKDDANEIRSALDEALADGVLDGNETEMLAAEMKKRVEKLRAAGKEKEAAEVENLVKELGVLAKEKFQLEAASKEQEADDNNHNPKPCKSDKTLMDLICGIFDTDEESEGAAAGEEGKAREEGEEDSNAEDEEGE